MSSIHCCICEATATSVEHVPPRCLFSEQKDLPGGVDLRKQFITVPSCDPYAATVIFSSRLWSSK